MLLPNKKSKAWLIVWGMIFFINIGAILLGRYLVGASFNAENASNFLIISLLIATIISIGYFGPRLFSGLALAANIIGITYMLYISATKAADSWSDLVGIIGFLYIVAIGIGIAIVVQVIQFIIKLFIKK